MRYVNPCDAGGTAERPGMNALIALVETLAAKVDLLTAKLAALETRIKTGECSCEKWRRHTGLPREMED